MMNGTGTNIGAMLCGLLFGLGIMSLIGSAVLRAAVAWYNSMSGGKKSPQAVKEPSTGKAFGIVLLVLAAIIGFGFVLDLVTAGGSAAAARTGSTTMLRGVQLMSFLISIPAGFLIMSGMLSKTLPTTFGRAMLVTLLFHVIFILIIAFFYVVLFLALGGSMMLGR